ncbi:enoyl-CoA hydratase/isomerase family protein [Roseomonas hellenica]|uniref:Enoyl-CoA hydratase/isomerase family protein n=1 Tax=Plastoroseomonas hellenica TaxID=2687306 RepID=A0ABS5ERF0_9PROT|nr:enoyl-CoA hydratase/isomerase family protein [Plastoroseomonas hellenica]MBR0662861.1 enoyl-CoA hydratase/isomerase family protein [Plastoroseomonas hellenica]
MEAESPPDLRVHVENHVATVELCRPPNNFIDLVLTAGIADALERLDEDPACRAVVLAAEGKHFCAGADFSRRDRRAGDAEAGTGRTIYTEGVRLLRTRKPIIAAVHGAAVGAGLGLAVVADFRVTCAEARFSANFTRLGYHPGFGLTETLPRLIGAQKASLLFYTGRRIAGDEAAAMGLADLLVPQAEVRAAATALAREIAESAPLAIAATRATMRRGLPELYERATAHELAEQARLRETEDFREGVKAMAERRPPQFMGR